MSERHSGKWFALGCAVLGVGLLSLGCQGIGGQNGQSGPTNRAQAPDVPAAHPVPGPVPQHAPPCADCADENGEPKCVCVPTELCKVSLPPYRIEPPDILMIDAVRMLPLPPYRIEPLDVLLITLAQPLPNQPLAGTYSVSPDGRVSLGFAYGSVQVAGMTLEEAEAAIRKQLSRVVANPQVSVGVGTIRAIQQVRGEHLVGPDGTISLGTYGDVYVAGMTRCEAKKTIEAYLSHYLMDPEISLAVYAYNSKVYYVITDGGGYGQQVYRFPATGNETVLDAISNITGLPAVASKKKIWVARPAPPCHDCDQILPVDWSAIVEGGSSKTNYQIFPGDRIYVKADCLIAVDNTLAKIISPIERLFGITLLGSTTVNSIRFNPNSNNNNNGGVFVGF